MAGYYKFDIGQLPNELYHPDVPVSKWLSLAQKVGADGFGKDTLNVLHDIDIDVEVERIMGIALYMAWNVIPFVFPLLCALAFFVPATRPVLWFCIAYVLILEAAQRLLFVPYFTKKYKIQRGGKGSHFDGLMPENDIRTCQFLYTERNSAKYLSVSYVWPYSMHRPNMEKTPLIYCAIPHGVGPIGLTTYPLWSSLWNDRICRWTAAPILFKLPLIGKFIARLGYIPASQKPILDILTKKDQNVGVILDGIDGMFHPPSQEIASILHRKGIVKIALKAGAPLVPVYCFGHTAIWTVIVDPFGILKWLSKSLGASLTPFFGRYFWFLGPPRRVPVAVVLGEPIKCPRLTDPGKSDVEKYHKRLLESYEELFDKHKAAYGWAHKKLKFV